MDDLCGFDRCNPCCDIGRHASFMEYSGMLSLAAMSWHKSCTIVLMFSMCSDL